MQENHNNHVQNDYIVYIFHIYLFIVSCRNTNGLTTGFTVSYKFSVMRHLLIVTNESDFFFLILTINY